MEKGFKRAWYILLILSWVSFSMSLEEAQRKALERSAEIRLETLELLKKKEEVKRSFGSFLPRVDLDLSLNFSRRLSFTLPGLPPLPPREFTFQRDLFPRATLLFRQDILNLTSRRSYELLRILERSQAYRLKEKRLEVLHRVREAYIEALKLKAVLKVYRKQLKRVEAHLRNVRELYREGVVPFKDVLETRVRLNEVRESVVSARSAYSKALSYLSYLVGERVGEVEEVDLVSLPDLSSLPAEELKRIALRSRPILLSLREAVRAREKGVDLARSYFYPTIVAEGFLQYTEESELFPRTRYLLSLALRWNVFSGLGRLRSLEIADLERLQDLERLRDLERRVALEVETTLEEIRTARARLELARVRLEEAREHLRIALEKYRAGLGTNAEVLDAESYLTEAEQRLRINTYDLMLKVFKLMRVVGYEG
jgi:outer membrane protein TolC